MNRAPPSRLAAFCEGLIEAAWLGALVIAVLFFNHLSFRSFEPDKAAMLRTILAVLVVAWLVRVLEAAFGRCGIAAMGRDRLRSVPMLLPALALWGSTLLATVLSVDWEISLHGSYERGQGLYTFSAYLALFVSVVLLMRLRQHFERLVTTLVVAAIPVSLLGLMQYQGIDPIPWQKTTGNPVVSTMGNTIFVAAWLVMVTPLVLHRLLESLVRGSRNLPVASIVFMSGLTVVLLATLLLAWPRSLISAAMTAATGLILLSLSARALGAQLRPWSQVWIYVVVLAAIVACTLLTERRGPFLGLLTGGFLFVVLQLAGHGRWRAVLGIVGISGLGLVMLVAAPYVAPSLIEDTPFARLTQILETGGSAGVRLYIWDSVLRLSAADPLRLLVGYGPDTLQLVTLPYLDPAIAGGQGGLPDRAHSITMDLLAGCGLLGVGVYAFLTFCIFRFALRWSGLVRGRGDRRLFLAASILGGGSLVLTVRVLEGSWRGLAVALPAALLVATLAIAIAASLRGLLRSKVSGGKRPSSRAAWSATLLSAIASHLVEAHVGIGIVATQTTFWLLVAALAAVGYRPALLRSRTIRPQGGSPSGPSAAVACGTGSSLVPNSLLVALMVSTLAFNFPLRDFAPSYSANILWLFGLTGLLAGVVVVSHAWSRVEATDSPGRLADVGVYLSIFLLTASVAGFVYSLPVSVELALVAPLAAYLIIAATIFIALSVWLMPPGHRAAVAFTPAVGGALYLLLPLLAAAVAIMNLQSLQADVLFKRGLMGSDRNGNYEDAAQWYGRALDLAPDQDHYYLLLGSARAKQAQRHKDQNRRDELFQQAAAAIAKAQELRPLHPVYPDTLGRLYLDWGGLTEAPVESSARLRQALGYFGRAADLNPNRPELWLATGDTLTLLGEHHAALENYRQAADLDPTSLNVSLALARSLQRLDRQGAASQVYRELLDQRPDVPELRRGFAEVLAAQGRYDAALVQLDVLIALAPDDADAHVARVRLFIRTGDCAGAQEALRKAYDAVRVEGPLDAVAREAAEACPPSPHI
jgi:tetratricopeptide (TPR) repeat protein